MAENGRAAEDGKEEEWGVIDDRIAERIPWGLANLAALLWTLVIITGRGIHPLDFVVWVIQGASFLVWCHVTWDAIEKGRWTSGNA